MKKKKAKVNVKVLDFSEFVKQIIQNTVLPKRAGNNLGKNTDVASMVDYLKGEKKDV